MFVQQYTNQKLIRDVFINEDTFATTLITLFIDNYGTQAFDWSPDTILLELNDDFNMDLPDSNFSRLLTAIDILTSDSFYNSLPDFNNYCNILSGDLYNPNLWEPADVSEIAWGITEVALLSPPDEDDTFNAEILAFIGKTLDDEGIVSPPAILQIATRDKDPNMDTLENFSDDPIMFDSLYDTAAAKTQAINEEVKHNLITLMGQLQRLPLSEGNTENMEQKISQLLKQDNS